MAELEPTYEELKQLRDTEWKTAQAIAQKQLADLQDSLMRMPDVVDAPSEHVQWSHLEVFCPKCAAKYFWVKRWVTVNGVRHRAEMVCASCGNKDTWDWATMKWMGG